MKESHPMMLKHPKTRKRNLEKATGGNGYGSPRNQNDRIGKTPDAVVLWSSPVIGGLWPGRGAKGVNTSHSTVLPLFLSSHAGTSSGQTQLEARGPGSPLMEVFKSRAESVLTIPWKPLCNNCLRCLASLEIPW